MIDALGYHFTLDSLSLEAKPKMLKQKAKSSPTELINQVNIYKY